MRQPRQSPRPRRRQQGQNRNSSGPASNASAAICSQSTPTNNSHTSTPSADGASANTGGASALAGSSEAANQQKNSNPATGQVPPRRRPPQEVENAMRDLTVTRRSRYRILTLQTGPTPPGAAGNWQQMTLTPLEGRSSPVTLPNGHVLTEPVRMWAQQHEDSNGPFRASTAQSQQSSRSTQRKRPSSNSEALRPSQGEQQLGSQPSARSSTGNRQAADGNSRHTPGSDPLRRFLESRQQTSQQPRSQMGHYQNEHFYSGNMQQTGPGRPQRPPLDNRRLRGARACIRLQEGEVKSGGKCESSGAQQEEDVPACVICTGPLSVRAQMLRKCCNRTVV